MPSAGRRQGGAQARAGILGAADDGARRAAAVIHGAYPEPVGLGVTHTLGDLGDDHALEALADGLHAFELGHREGEALGQGREVEP